LYCDFNALNILYETNVIVPSTVTLYPDSTAVFAIINFFRRSKLKKIVSTDFQSVILNKAINQGIGLYFFGDADDVLEEMVRRLKMENTGINICGVSNGFCFDTKAVINNINCSKADILFVGLGAGQQEKWIIENYEKLDIKFVLSVGGWFRFLAKTKKRAPQIFRKLSLEWLYRLITEFPHVWKRYLIGVPKFFYRVITKKIVLVID